MFESRIATTATARGRCSTMRRATRRRLLLLPGRRTRTGGNRDDPPVIIFYGDQDKVVPPSQNEELHKRYQHTGLDSSLHLIKGAGHGGPQFSDTERYDLVKAFVDRHIKQKADNRTPGVETKGVWQ
jgi:pimeloyl-ACP methyl ester carboxylesterase